VGDAGWGALRLPPHPGPTGVGGSRPIRQIWKRWCKVGDRWIQDWHFSTDICASVRVDRRTGSPDLIRTALQILGPDPYDRLGGASHAEALLIVADPQNRSYELGAAPRDSLGTWLATTAGVKERKARVGTEPWEEGSDRMGFGIVDPGGARGQLSRSRRLENCSTGRRPMQRYDPKSGTSQDDVPIRHAGRAA